MNVRALFDLFKQAFSSWKNDYAPSMGAALAYYTIFSVAPLLLIVISVAGLVFGQDAARGEIFAQLSGLMGAQGALAVQGMLEAVNKPMEGIVATVIGVTILVVGATTVFGELQDAMDRIWRAPAREETSGVWSIVRVRLLSFSMVMGIGFLLMVSLVASAALAALGKWWAPVFGGWATLAQGVNFAFSFVMVTVVFAMIYKLMPRVRVEWRDVWIGAGVTALLFTVGKHLIGLYIGKSSVASGYGAAGSLVVVLVWVYYSAQIFLLGAEFTWVYAQRFGSLRQVAGPASPADETAPLAAAPGTTPERATQGAVQ
jgi:membrane protein